MPYLPERHTQGITAKKHGAQSRQHSRQFRTDSAIWRRMRAQVLAEEPLCRTCLEQGVTTPGIHVDHIDGDSWNNLRENLQSLCPSCHSRKTAKEQKSQN